MTDPLIGLSFDPAVVRLEEWKDSPATLKEMGPSKKWIFGCAPVAAGRVCIIAGFRTVRSEGAAPVTEPDFGGVVQEQAATHKVLGAPERLFDKQPLVAAAIRDELLRDAVSRYIKAWGGADKLRAAIRSQIPLDTIPPALADALRAAGVALNEQVARRLRNDQLSSAA